MGNTTIQERCFHFPDKEWWNARIICGHVPQYRIDHRPDDAAEYGTTAETIIIRMVERLVGRFNPMVVWLFGSMARGDCNEHSGVDLLVIMPEGTDRKATTQDMLLEVVCSMLPKDIVVNTPEQWSCRVDDVGSLQHAVSKHGMMLYG